MGKWNKTTPNYNVQQCCYYYIYRSHSRTIAIDSPRQVSKSDFTAWWHETNFTEAYCSKIHKKSSDEFPNTFTCICTYTHKKGTFWRTMLDNSKAYYHNFEVYNNEQSKRVSITSVQPKVPTSLSATVCVSQMTSGFCFLLKGAGNRHEEQG